MRIIACPKCKAALEIYIDEGIIECPRCGEIISIKKL